MAHSPEASWAPPPSPPASPLPASPLQLCTTASPRRSSFRERLADLAAEHEELQARCESLSADNRELRERLAAAEAAAAAADRGRDATAGSPAREADSSSLALQRLDLATDGFRAVEKRVERLLSKRSEAESGPEAVKGSGEASGTAALPDEDAESGSSSSSGSEESAGRPHHQRRRRRHRRRRSHASPGRPRRRRRHAREHGREHGREHTREPRRSRGRSCGLSCGRSRSRRPRLISPRREGRGQYGSGDHKRDLEDFCTRNQLEARVIGALKTLSDADQKKVMGTDGGENSYMLIDRVKNPNGVVMSRIRKIESGG